MQVLASAEKEKAVEQFQEALCHLEAQVGAMDMASEEVLIIGVEDSSDIVYLGKKVTKGKDAAHPAGKRRSKKSSRNGKESESCLVIVDSSSGSEDGYLEVTGGGGGKSGKDSASSDLESVVCPPPKKLRMSSSRHSDTDLTVIVDVTSTKPPEEKLRFHEDSVTEDATKIAALPSTATTSSSASSKYSTDDNQSDHTPSKDPPPSAAPSQSLAGAHHERVPTCWTNCPNCPPDMQRMYHLIDVAYNSAEWSVVSSPLTQLGFVVNRVQRIQNETLWQRLCYEKKLMLRDRHDVNEQLLYHTSKATIPVICEEGLDHRLSMNGHFGRGIYFRLAQHNIIFKDLSDEIDPIPKQRESPT